MALGFHVSRIASPGLIGLNRRLHVVRGLFRGIPCNDSPVHPSASHGNLGVHIQHPPVVARLSQSKRADGDVGLDMLAVVCVPGDFPQIPVTSGQEEFTLVLADHEGGMGVPDEPHRPERLGNRFVHPVNVRTSRGSQVNVKRPPFLVVTQGHGCISDSDIPEFIGNHVRSHRGQIRPIGIHAVEAVFREEHDGSIGLHPGFRADDAHFLGNTLERPARGRITLNHPQPPRGSAEEIAVQAGNQGGGARPHVCS